LSVLVVGGGPTGLAAAAALAKLGIKFRIIEKSLVRSDKSRALGIQSGTLECFDHVFGKKVSEKLISIGRIARQANIHIDSKEPIEIDFSVIKKPYDFILILAQDQTEAVLEEHLNSLGVQVEKGCELVELNEAGDDVVARVQKTNGEFEEIKSKFVIGCDGAHSAVRRLCKIPFVGGQYSGNFVLGDVEIKWPWTYDSLRVFANERGVIACFPMTGAQKYRLIMIPKNEPVTENTDISEEEFKSITTHLSFDRIEVLKANWLTRFRVHHRIVDNMQRGRIFLAGDAAHIHSPAGGQGMNIGIQDGLNLAYKLKKVLENKKPLEFLEKYHEERYPVARTVIQNTDFFFRLGIMNENWMTSLARKTVVPVLAKNSWITKKVVRGISEVQWARREISERLI
jgi:3-(3-hydroxy-phenyl)propionate hydroxylase